MDFLVHFDANPADVACKNIVTRDAPAMDESSPILVINSFEWPGESGGNLRAKIFAASLMRSLFTGTIVVFRNREMPLFKVERRQLEEIFVPLRIAEEGAAAERRARMEFLNALGIHLRPAPRQWVILADPASVALRNIDHLFPAGEVSASSKPEILWVPAGDPVEAARGHEGAAGFIAVRGERLPALLDGWMSALRSAPHDPTAHARLRTERIQESGLIKRRFESGEISAPAINAVNWRTVASSALVTVGDWPAEERTKFLQALYFGTYLGDKSGMMLNILEVWIRAFQCGKGEMFNRRWTG